MGTSAPGGSAGTAPAANCATAPRIEAPPNTVAGPRAQNSILGEHIFDLIQLPVWVYEPAIISGAEVFVFSHLKE
jgi:hypothetical protein